MLVSRPKDHSLRGPFVSVLAVSLVEVQGASLSYLSESSVHHQALLGRVSRQI